MRLKNIVRCFLAILLLSSVLLSLPSCSSDKREYCEIGIVLPKEFQRIEAEESFDLAFSDGTRFV